MNVRTRQRLTLTQRWRYQSSDFPDSFTCSRSFVRITLLQVPPLLLLLTPLQLQQLNRLVLFSSLDVYIVTV